MAEDYVTRCQEYEITQATVDALKDKGVTSLKSVCLLTASLIQKHLKPLPPGGKLFCSSRTSNPLHRWSQGM